MNVKKLIQASALCLLALPFTSFAGNKDYLLTIEAADGSVHTANISSFSVGLEGEPPTAALLLPAVQSVSSAARRVHNSAAEGEVFTSMSIESNSRNVYFRWDMTKVRVTSYSMNGSAVDDSPPAINVSFNYTKVETTYNEQTTSYDCSSGICQSTSLTGR